jgi:RNA 2',3'-cyclic 3'-phosphodiesterase
LSERIRSFIAFDLESQEVLAKLTYVQKLLVETGADLRPVVPQNIHVTIRFLGYISPAMVDKIHESLKNVKFTPFAIQIKGIGVFPNLNYPRVVWAAMTNSTEQLKGIFSQLEPQIKALGFAADQYGFSPHLTIARVRSAKNKQNLAEFITKKTDYEFGTIRAECLRLKQSQLSPKGPTYSTLREFCPLKQQ